MDNATTKIRLEQWARLIAECNSSTLTKTDWCRQNNVSIKSFFYWQRKIRSRVIEAGGVPTFVELKEPCMSAIENTAEYSGIPKTVTPAAILQKNGFNIILTNAADHSFLRELLEALKND